MAKSTRFVVVALLSVITAMAFSATDRAAAGSFNCNSSFDSYRVSDATRAACGIGTFPLEAVVTHPDGGKDYVYTVQGLRTIMPVPPAGFNALRATPEKLKEYGFPERPTDPASLSLWLKMMSNLHPVTPPQFLTSVHVKRQPKIQATYALSNWAGWAATGNNGSYYLAEGYWNEVSLGQSCSGSNELTWAGLGGLTSSVLAQDGSAMNVSGLSQHQGWSEVLPDQGNVVPINVYGAAGYGFVAMTEHLNGYYEFYEYSYANGGSSVTYTNTSHYSGDSADFVIERGTHSGGLVPLSNFSYLTYKDAWVNGNSSGNGVGNYSNQNITMFSTDFSHVLADTSGLTNNLTFTVNYHSCQ